MPNTPTTNALPRGDLLGSLYETTPDRQYIALDILPPMPVPKNKGAFGRIPAEALHSRADVKRARKSGYNVVDFETEEDTYRCHDYGITEIIDDVEEDIYEDQFSYMEVAAQRLRNILLLEQEIRVRDLIHNTTTFPNNNTDGMAVNNEWDDADAADIINDIATGKSAVRNKCGVTPDSLQIAYETWNDLWRNDRIRDNIKYTREVEMPDPTDAAARSAMARYLGVRRILVGDLPYNGAKEGQDVSWTEVWQPEYAFLFVSAKTSDIRETCLGRTFSYERQGGLLMVDQYYDDDVRAEKLRVRQFVGEKILLTACGFLFQNIHT